MEAQLKELQKKLSTLKDEIKNKEEKEAMFPLIKELQSNADKSGKNQDFKARAQRAADRNKKK